jgi:hypothetical protein
MPTRIYILEALALGPVAYKVFQMLSENLSPWLSGPLVFMLVLLSGDLLLVLFERERATRYLDDALIDSFVFALLGLLAAVSYQAADLYLAVQPNLGLIAVLVFLLFLSITENSRRYR